MRFGIKVSLRSSYLYKKFSSKFKLMYDGVKLFNLKEFKTSLSEVIKNLLFLILKLIFLDFFYILVLIY